MMNVGTNPSSRKRSMDSQAQYPSDLFTDLDIPFTDSSIQSIPNEVGHATNEFLQYMENKQFTKEQDPQVLFKAPIDGYDFSEHLNMDMFPTSPGLYMNPVESHNMSIDTSETPMHLYNSSVASSPSSSPSSTEVKHTSVQPTQDEHCSPSSKRSSTSFTQQKTSIPALEQPTPPKREISEALTNYQFGREANFDVTPEHPIPPTLTGLNAPSYMPDFNPSDWQNTSDLKYGLQIEDVPSKSRVETQIKVVMNFYPPPSETIVHLPADTISKPKLQLRTPFKPIPSALIMDTVVLCDSDLNRFVNICQGCMKRERKRAFRKKVRLPSEEAHWQENKEKRAAVFNCREVVDFGPLVNIDVNGKTVPARQLELPMRMSCYCRHHNEKNGFRAFFVVRDYTGTVVARGSTKGIMITDDHKANNLKSSSAGVKRPNSDVDTLDVSAASTRQSSAAPEEAVVQEGLHASQPVSRKRKTSENTPISHNFPKPKPAVPQRHRNATPPSSFTPISTPNFEFAIQSPVSPRRNNLSSYPRTASFDNLNVAMSRPISTIPSPRDSPVNILSSPKQSVDEWASQDSNLPTIQRIIPASGSIRGGIEVTLLGSGFVNGLITKFGENKSMATHCWNSTTIVASLPPTRVAGPVVVTFEGFAMPDPQVFSYYDDTDRELIELALQVVGLKMNGRLEDARDIARRIVGSSTAFDPSHVQQLRDTAGAYNRGTSLSVESLDALLLKCIDLIDSFESDYTANWQLSNSEGQTMLHLSASLGLKQFTLALIDRSSSLDIQDKSGFSALHFAAMHKHDSLVNRLITRGARTDLRTYKGFSYIDLINSQEPISQRSFEFNDDGESSSESEEEESEDDFEEPTAPDLTQRVASYLASWTSAASVFRAISPAREVEEVDEHEEFWDQVYPDTGEISREPEPEHALPPSYEEIFPAGSSSGDFSAVALEAEKPTIEPEVVRSEEEELELWKNQRKQIQNDRMFLFFWLPVFIFMLVWVSMKAVTYFDAVDASANLQDKISAVLSGFFGIKKLPQIVPDALENNPPPLVV